MLSLPDPAAFPLTLSAGFGWVNNRFLKRPGSIGLLGLVASLMMVLLDLAYPRELLLRELTEALQAIDFEKPSLLAASCAVAVNTVLVQGGSLGRVARRVVPAMS